MLGGAAEGSVISDEFPQISACTIKSEFRQVVRFGNVRQYDGLQLVRDDALQQAGAIGIGQMPEPATDALLELPRIGAVSEHLRIVVAFQDNHIQTCQNVGH